jgi:linoleoyl-CoA desaturase
VRALFEKYGLTYTTGSLPRQVASAWAKVIRLALPNDLAAKAEPETAPVTPIRRKDQAA